jgi:DNA-directed RNA polymerase subunit K/omega
MSDKVLAEPDSTEPDQEPEQDLEQDTDLDIEQDNSGDDASTTLDDDDDDDDDNEDDDEDDEEPNMYKQSLDSKKLEVDDKISAKNIFNSEKMAYTKYDHDVEDLDESDFNKFNDDYKKNHTLNYHNECLYKNFNEIKELCKVSRNKDGIIVDELHKTIPLLTKYEKTKILGMRLKQLNSGCSPYISINEKLLDNNIIVLMELEQKVLPFIIQRPLPNNTFEYWKLEDLDIL